MANLSSKTGFSPIQTQVNFSAVNSATSVQDFAAYDAQELQGFVYVNTTSTGALTLRASVKVMVVKNGAGTYEVASVDISGDNVAGNPIVSFSMSGSVLRATLSSSITGTWGSGYIRYQLSAPYLGGNYPLSVSASQVLGSVTGTAPAAGYIGETYEALQSVSQVPGASATAFNVLSYTPPAGRWKVEGSFLCQPGSAGTTYGMADINTSVAFRTGPVAYTQLYTSGNNVGGAIYPLIVNSTGSTVVYLVGQMNYSTIGSGGIVGRLLFTRIG